MNIPNKQSLLITIGFCLAQAACSKPAETTTTSNPPSIAQGVTLNQTPKNREVINPKAEELWLKVKTVLDTRDGGVTKEEVEKIFGVKLKTIEKGAQRTVYEGNKASHVYIIFTELRVTNPRSILHISLSTDDFGFSPRDVIGEYYLPTSLINDYLTNSNWVLRYHKEADSIPYYIYDKKPCAMDYQYLAKTPPVAYSLSISCEKS